MRAVYDAFCHSEEDPAFRERTWENRTDLLPDWTKCRTDIAYLPQKLCIRAPGNSAQARPVHCQAVRDLIDKFEENDCICDRPQSGRPSFPMKTVAVVHQTITTVRLARARGVSRVLHLPNSTVHKILRSVLNMFPLRFQRVHMLEERSNKLRIDFANKVLIRCDEDSSWPLSIL